MAAQNERADLFRAGPFKDTIALEVGARIRKRGY
jgi:hypothetical protein